MNAWAYKEGQDAKANGGTSYDNPYSVYYEPEARAAWLSGFEAA